MSKETRTIRPFVGIEKLERTLEPVLLYFGQDSCEPDSTLLVDVEPQEYMLRPVTLCWASDEQSFAQMSEDLKLGAKDANLPLDSMALVAVASTPFLKSATVAFYHSLTELETLKRVVVLSEPERPAAFCAPFNGFVLDVYLLLSRSLAPRPLTPHIQGTWIARSRFRIETKLVPALLPPTPLTDELRKELGLPPKVTRYVSFGDHNPLEPYIDQEQPVFYVDDELLAQLNVRRYSSTSKAIQIQLVHDFLASVIRRGSVHREELKGLSFADVRTSLLGSVVRLAAGPGATDDLRDHVIDLLVSDPEKVIARVEHSIGLGEGFLGALKDGEA